MTSKSPHSRKIFVHWNTSWVVKELGEVPCGNGLYVDAHTPIFWERLRSLSVLSDYPCHQGKVSIFDTYVNMYAVLDLTCFRQSIRLTSQPLPMNSQKHAFLTCEPFLRCIRTQARVVDQWFGVASRFRVDKGKYNKIKEEEIYNTIEWTHNEMEDIWVNLVSVFCFSLFWNVNNRRLTIFYFVKNIILKVLILELMGLTLLGCISKYDKRCFHSLLNKFDFFDNFFFDSQSHSWQISWLHRPKKPFTKCKM